MVTKMVRSFNFLTYWTLNNLLFREEWIIFVYNCV